MSGKGEGKKHNRAAQSAQHGYQEAPDEQAGKKTRGSEAGASHEGESERERVLEKLKRFHEEQKAEE